MSNIHPFPVWQRGAGQVGFDRPELMRILDLYGRMVAAGLWRDYAIDMGRDAARDRAELVLHQFGQPVQAKVAAPSAAAVVASVPKPAPLILTEPLAPPAPKIVQPRRPPPRPASATQTPQSVVPARPVVPQKGTALREICEPALARIARHGREADATMRAAGAAGLARLAEDTAALVQWISDHLDGAPSGAPGLVELREAAFDAADLVQLMQLEGGPATLGESLSLLIQLKHEIETALARSEVAIPAACTSVTSRLTLPREPAPWTSSGAAGPGIKSYRSPGWPGRTAGQSGCTTGFATSTGGLISD